MGGNGLKVDWKKAAREALRQESEEWNEWKWRLTDKRMKSYRFLLSAKTERWGIQYYLTQLKPNFGASHPILGLKKRDYSALETF